VVQECSGGPSADGPSGMIPCQVEGETRDKK
jgi:hypothetical protein